MCDLDSLNDIEILECAQCIYNFLIDDVDYTSYKSISDIPSFRDMENTLDKYNTDMIPFTHFLNCKYQISSKLWENSPREFFTTKSHNFYKSIIRKLKLLCLKDQN